jgi:poly-gamma-glutamate capsule biosynthesis protein CapA/YwtB (metallophosphatase superfamily)
MQSRLAEKCAGGAVSVFISGDFCPAMLPVDWWSNENAAKAVFGGLLESIRTADLSITNLECPLTLCSIGIKKIGPTLKAHPETSSVLKSAGFGMVTLANNHIYDYGQKGLLDTFEALQSRNLSYVGAGRSLQEARKALFVEIKHLKLAIVNFTEIEFSCANSAHGGANPMDLIDNAHQIQAARSNADQVLVIIHGGHEHSHYPSPETLKRYRFYAEVGASVVVAHHTHCIGGYERHNGVPIFYSLGNFLFPVRNNMPSFWYEGYAVLLKIERDSLTFEVLPYEQCKKSVLSIDRSRSKEILGRILDINRVLADDAKIRAHWQTFTEERSQYYLSMISGLGGRMTGILYRLGLLEHFYRKLQLTNVRQMIRCEAHKEAALEVLSRYLR